MDILYLFFVGFAGICCKYAFGSSIYLNHTSITLKKTISLTQGFQVSFRACSAGVILNQGQNIQLSFSGKNGTSHGKLKLEWKINDSIFYNVELSPKFSIDTNVHTEVKFYQNGSDFMLSFRTQQPELEDIHVPVLSKYLENVTANGMLRLGSAYFSGCIYKNVDIDIPTGQLTDCPLELLKPCIGKVCPQGFAGRYCEENIDDCKSNKEQCHFSSTCVDLVNGFKCLCKPRYFGRLCDEYLGPPCNETTCQNNGICRNIDDGSNYTCYCQNGFIGRNCEKQFFPCMSDPCKNGGSCSNSTGIGYHCSCLPGYLGKNCERLFDNCASRPCNAGVCVNQLGNFTCNCSNSGFTGAFCEKDVNECSQVNCNNGKCVNKFGSYECICRAGYTGHFCSVDIKECEMQPCKNNASCTEPFSGNFSCQCQPGYKGVLCEININECIPGRCLNNGSCHDLINNYTCTCQPGFKGINCEENIDECLSIPCLHNGTCNDEVNNYTCSCKRSYTGRNCEIYQDPCNPSPCQNGGTCFNDTLKDYKCQCTDEFGGDDCQFKRGLCFPNNPCKHGKCNETNDIYNCTCDPGYTGVNCTDDINECLTVQCTYGKCLNTIGSFVCNCTTGFEGQFCDKEINACLSNPCLNGATCRSENGTAKCQCSLEFFGKYCASRILVCSQYKGQHKEDYCKNGQCIEIGNLQMKCNCTAGYEGNRCDKDIDECEFRYCKNNATCTDLFNDYNCTCAPGFTGRNCSIDINECKPNPCSNNATCEDLINSYECFCKPGYTGSNCETDIDWCVIFPCQNGGSCVDGVDSRTCRCFSGYEGENCEKDINECSPKPCMYIDAYNRSVESICIEKSNLTAMLSFNQTVNITSFENRDGYLCQCVDGVNGQNCSQDIPDCNSKSCKNNASCIDLVDSFDCVCLPGYTGRFCENEVRGCDSRPCKNNGTCINQLNGYVCQCLSLTTGKDCEKTLHPCIGDKLCQNNATCKFVDSTPTCVCSHGYFGELCEQITTVNFHGYGYWILNGSDTSVPENSISLRFITTIPDGIIFFVSGSSGQRINVFLRNGNVFYSINDRTYELAAEVFDDNQWHTIDINFNHSYVSFHLNTFKSTRLVDLGNLSKVSVGGAGEEQGNYSSFVGCMQDIKLDKEVVLSKDGFKVNVTSGVCRKSSVCQSSVCNHRGKCIDLWNSRKCECKRQYYGSDCENEITSFNFQVTNSTRQRRSTDSITARAMSTVNFTFTRTSSFSYLIRTRHSDGVIALLLTSDAVNKNEDFAYTQHVLIDGKLNIFEGNKTQTQRIFSPYQLNDGVWHEIVQSGFQISDNKKTTQYSSMLHNTIFEIVYFGDITHLTSFPNATTVDTSFRGCLQAVSMDDITLSNQQIASRITKNITLTNVGDGCQSADVCAQKPCLYGGTCNDLWNAYNCTCKHGFTGQNCALYGCDFVNTCPSSTVCIDVTDQPGHIRCSSALTYNGENSTSRILLNTSVSTLSFSLRTRQRDTIVLSSYETRDSFIVIGITSTGLLKIYARVNGTNTTIIGTDVSDGKWRKIDINGTILKNNNDSIIINDATPLVSLLSHTNMIIGKHDTLTQTFTNSYQGCIKGVSVDGQVIDLNYATSSFVIFGCNSTNPCQTSPCVAGECRDIFNDFECICPNKYYTRKTCNETMNVTCEFSPALCNNSTCVNLTSPVIKRFSDHGFDFFKCNCLVGYEGHFCERQTNECRPNPCLNNATCLDRMLDYDCLCTHGWTGKNCSGNVNDCASDPCNNNGSCVDLVGDYRCNCTKTGYTGRNCSEDVDECKMPDTCLHGGNCSNLVGGFRCNCSNGYFGDQCEYENAQQCAILAPCKNKASCISNSSGFFCTCMQGFTGKTCEEDFNECNELVPCQNDASCSDSHTESTSVIVPGYNCTCTERYEGKNCSEEKDPCDSKPCKNNGNCTKVSYNEVRCACEPGFSGHYCDDTGGDDDGVNLGLILGLSIPAVILLLLLLFFFFNKFVRDKSGMEGTYSPNKEEQQVGNVEMNTLKKPNAERLI